MSITDFMTWVENHLDPQIDSPASAEVIRTGLQPQVDADNSMREKENHDEIMALDSHVQRMVEVARRMKADNETGKKAQALVQQFAKAWNKILTDTTETGSIEGLGSDNPSQDQLNYMKDNQPLPDNRGGFRSGKPPLF
jgi:branched-subunit amino acid aminotransferase/4-amino-4-deoxychorismate lyase